MTKRFYLVNICDIFFIILNMLKGANLKGGRCPSAPYWPAATDEKFSKDSQVPMRYIDINSCSNCITISLESQPIWIVTYLNWFSIG